MAIQLANAAQLYKQIGTDVPGQLDRLTQSLIGIHERKLARQRQEEMDALAAEAQRQRLADEEEQRQMRLLEFRQKLAAQTPAKQRPQTFEESQTAEVAPGKAPMAIPDTPEERAAFEAAPPSLVPEPSQPVTATIGGQQVSAPMLNRDELFQRKLEELRQEEAARQPSYTIPQSPEFGGLAGVEIPEAAVGTVFGRVLGRDSQDKLVERTVDLGNKVEYIYSDGSREVKPKGRIPVDEPGGMSTRQNISLGQITTKFQADPVMQQAAQGTTISSIADQVIADPGRAVNQLKSLYILVKNLDPTSAVREGELGLAQATQSYLQQWGTKLQRVTEGQVIAPGAAQELAQATKEIAMLWNQAAKRRESQYKAQAGVMGVGPQFEQYLGGFTPNYGDGGQTPPVKWGRDASGKPVRLP